MVERADVSSSRLDNRGGWRRDPVTLVWLIGSVVALMAAGTVAGTLVGGMLATRRGRWLCALAGLWAGGGVGALLGAWHVVDRAAVHASRRAFNRLAFGLAAMALWPAVLIAPTRGIPFALAGAATTMLAGLTTLWLTGRFVAKRVVARRTG